MQLHVQHTPPPPTCLLETWSLCGCTCWNSPNVVDIHISLVVLSGPRAALVLGRKTAPSGKASTCSIFLMQDWDGLGIFYCYFFLSVSLTLMVCFFRQKHLVRSCIAAGGLRYWMHVLQMFYFLMEAMGDHCFHFPWLVLGKSHGISRRGVKAHMHLWCQDGWVHDPAELQCQWTTAFNWLHSKLQLQRAAGWQGKNQRGSCATIPLLTIPSLWWITRCLSFQGAKSSCIKS